VLSYEATDVGRDIMVRLKDETAAGHARLDAAVEPMLKDLHRYRQLLAALRDAQRAIECQLARHAEPMARFGYDVAARSKLRWLDDDLAVLRMPTDDHMPVASFSLDDASAAFGAAYVSEGATLGGQVIARMVMPSLSLSPCAGCRYFTGYGAATGDRWRETRMAIGGYVLASSAPDVEARIIGGARLTFALVEGAVRARGRP